MLKSQMQAAESILYSFVYYWQTSSSNWNTYFVGTKDECGLIPFGQRESRVSISGKYFFIIKKKNKSKLIKEQLQLIFIIWYYKFFIQMNREQKHSVLLLGIFKAIFNYSMKNIVSLTLYCEITLNEVPAPFFFFC